MTENRQAAEAILNELIAVMRESLLQGIERVLETQSITVQAKTPVKAEKALERPSSVTEEAWQDWMRIRKAKYLPLTATAWKKIVGEIKLSGLTPQQAIELCCENGWAGFKASWLNKDRPVSGFQGDI
jgi:hypothetical protein